MISPLTNIKRGLFGVLVIGFAISAFANYLLINKVSDLSAINQTLSQTIDNQEAVNKTLSAKISDFATERKQLQLTADEATQRERQTKYQLSTRIHALELELNNETCSNQPISYPIDWVSRY